LDVRGGDGVTVAIRGAYGKPRPALVMQADLFNNSHASVTILPLTSTIVDAPLFRITVDPSRQNGLAHVSQIMVDKVLTVPRQKVRKPIGHLGNDLMIRVSRALLVCLGFA
jgi:mRNA interferase MazF